MNGRLKLFCGKAFITLLVAAMSGLVGLMVYSKVVEYRYVEAIEASLQTRAQAQSQAIYAISDPAVRMQMVAWQERMTMCMDGNGSIFGVPSGGLGRHFSSNVANELVWNIQSALVNAVIKDAEEDCSGRALRDVALGQPKGASALAAEAIGLGYSVGAPYRELAHADRSALVSLVVR